MKERLKISVSKALKKGERMYHVFVLAMIMATVYATPAYATTTPKLVSGTVDLFKAVTTWLLLIIPVGAGAVLGYHALQKSLTDDQAIIAEKNKMMKNVIIGAAIAETASGLVTIVLGFYS